MNPKVVPGYSTHRNSHPTLYEGNNSDYYFSLLPLLVPFSFLTISNECSWRNPIQSSKTLYSLLGVYQMSESTLS